MALMPGVRIQLGTQKYLCPALCLDDVQVYLPQIEAMQKGPMTPEKFDLVKECVHAALIRNYPDLDIKVVGKGLDLRNFKEVLDAVMARSGLTEVEPGEDQAAGASP